jgi:ABC-type nitrate/sulfonate/bicarbonate transport system ATPase subunit
MAGRIYIGQPVEVVINVTVDGAKLTTGASAKIEVMKPNKAVVQWDAVVDNVAGTVSYAATAEDIDLAGKWRMQPLVTLVGIPERTIPGNTVEMDVSRRFM